MRAFRPRRRCRPVVAGIAGVLLAAGCSSGGDGTASPSAGAPATPVAAGSPAELADRLACTGLAPVADIVEPTVDQQGTCTFAGGTVTLYTFRTPESLTSWADNSVRATGVEAVLFGPTWAVAFPSLDAGRAAQQRLGGRLV